MTPATVRWCAVCTRDIMSTEKERYAPLGRNGASVRICTRCDSEAVRCVDGVRNAVTRGLDPRAERIRAHRMNLSAAGICVNGEAHGKATHGVRCEQCYRRDHERNQARKRP